MSRVKEPERLIAENAMHRCWVCRWGISCTPCEMKSVQSAEGPERRLAAIVEKVGDVKSRLDNTQFKFGYYVSLSKQGSSVGE